MPAAFQFPSPDIDVWLPLPDGLRSLTRSARYLDVIGRLAPAVTPGRARDVLQTIAVGSTPSIR